MDGKKGGGTSIYLATYLCLSRGGKMQRVPGHPCRLPAGQYQYQYHGLPQLRPHIFPPHGRISAHIAIVPDPDPDSVPAPRRNAISVHLESAGARYRMGYRMWVASLISNQESKDAPFDLAARFPS